MRTVNGTVALGGAALDLSLGYAPPWGDRLFIVVNDGTDAVGGTFVGLPQAQLFGVDYSGTTYRMQISYEADSATGDMVGGNDVAIYHASETLFLFK